MIRNRHVSTTLTAEEYARYRVYADRTGQGLTEALRALLLMALDMEDGEELPAGLTDDVAISELGLHTRTERALEQAGVTMVSQLWFMDDDQLRAINGIGKAGLAEIREAQTGSKYHG